MASTQEDVQPAQDQCRELDPSWSEEELAEQQERPPMEKSGVYVDPFAQRDTGRFKPGQTVHMGIIENGIRTKGIYKIHQGRPSRFDYYEYQLLQPLQIFIHFINDGLKVVPFRQISKVVPFRWSFRLCAGRSALAKMAPTPTPTRRMTGDTFVNDVEKGPQSPTDTEHTLGGDVIIEMGEEHDASSRRSSSDSRSRSSTNEAPAQPHDDEKSRPTFLRRVTGSFRSEPDPPGVTEISTRQCKLLVPHDTAQLIIQVDNTPNGYPRLAAFQSSESNFSLYRSFTYLHSRVLLDLQDDIAGLERELDEIDWDDFDEDPSRLRSCEFDRACDENDGRTRRVILKEIRAKLMEYDEVLIKARTLDSFQKPSDRNYRSVRRFHYNHKPLMDAETEPIRSKEDTVSLRNSGREGGSFDGGLEKAIFKFDEWVSGMLRRFGVKEHPSSPLGRYFQSPELRAKTTNKYITLYSSTRIDKLANILITLVIFALLVVPVVAMYMLTSTTAHIGNESGSTDSSALDANTRDTLNAVGLLIVFTLLFSAAMSLLTKAARHELFAASAAYCAILVVFIGNFTGPGN
ncbi:hypothetical protein BU23DRAFT_596575 [Bimuria novae-zelandiae CBS 107.79]|uniref:DUF6594 domain-containing protein n=1 Tax=Bimuria novae-zelandiae CBS 107.79 TaxID=1447943 RepID=A0A6A5VQ78_9PLEO|nr:hypothetical protein BU23DRAFT_596575 [Bimuria novae-zelandiae CBS 107.79]